MRVTKKIFILFLTFFLIIMSGCSKHENKNKDISADNIVDKKEPKEKIFILNSVNDGNISLKLTQNGIESKDLKDKVLMLNFFATWCPPCKAEIPHLVNLQNKYKDKLQIVAVLLEENKDINKLKSFINEYKINYFVSISEKNFALAKKVYAMVHAPRNMPIPLSVMFKDGKYIIHYLGAVPEEMIETDIKNALGD